MDSTFVALVSYRKQGVVGVDLALDGKYSYGPRFVPKAEGGGGGSRFGWKIQRRALSGVRYRAVGYQNVRHRAVGYRDVRYRAVGYRDVRYRGTSPFTLCAIGMCAIGHYGRFTVCYRDVCYRTVR